MTKDNSKSLVKFDDKEKILDIALLFQVQFLGLVDQ